jgi:hypothetical protein
MNKFIFLFLFVTELLASSGKYKPEPFRPKGGDFKVNSTEFKPSDKNYKLFVEDPKPKNEKDLKDFIYAKSRNGVTINNLNYRQSVFTIKGTYKTENNLSQFLEKIKKSIRSDKGFDLKTTKTRFAGAVTNHYEVSIVNLF